MNYTLENLNERLGQLVEDFYRNNTHHEDALRALENLPEPTTDQKCVEKVSLGLMGGLFTKLTALQAHCDWQRGLVAKTEQFIFAPSVVVDTEDYRHQKACNHTQV